MNTKKENGLPAAGSTAAIAHLRAVNADGASVIATPAQIREMVGIDYSSLVEQEVRGEFAYNGDLIKSQVYTRSFIGITGDGFYTPLPLTLPKLGRVIDVFGSALSSLGADPITAASIARYTSGSNSFGLWHKQNFREDGGVIPSGTTFYLTIKYVK